MKYVLSKYEAMQAIANYVRSKSLDIKHDTTLYVEVMTLGTEEHYAEVTTRKAVPPQPREAPKPKPQAILTPAQERFRRAWVQHKPSHSETAKALQIKTNSVGPYLSVLRGKGYDI